MHAFRASVRLSVACAFAAASTSPATAWAQASFGPGQLAFAPTFVGRTSAAQVTTLTNASSETVFLLAGSLGNTDYSLQTSDCPFSSAATLVPFGPGASCTIAFQFTPSIVGPDDASYVLPIVDASFRPLGSAVVSLGGAGQFPLVFSPSSLDFGYVRENLNSAPSQPVAITNAGGVPIAFGAAIANPDYSVDALRCASGFFPPDASCAIAVSFNPTIAGSDPAALVVTASIYGGRELGQAVVPVAGSGHPLAVPSFVAFGVDLLGGSYRQPVVLLNASDSPVNIRAASVSGSGFSQDGACIGALGARATCAITVTYTPTAAGPAAGVLTLVDDDATSPQAVQLTAAATALEIAVQDSGFQDAFAFFDQPLGTTSRTQTVTLTNVARRPVRFATTLAAPADAGFATETTCRKSQVPAGGSCVVSVTYTPAADGISRGTLTIAPADPIGPTVVTLLGDGVGIAKRTIRLHYDYMVAADHTHDPEAAAPGAIQRVIDAFARHGVTLIVDPHHAAIPEVETVTFSTDPDPRIVCPNSQANFLDVRDRYFVRRFPGQHYTLFGHFAVDAAQVACGSAAESGEADLPGLDSVVASAILAALPADEASFAVSGTLMHELGHNLGLHHGGGYGIQADDINNKPNYLSVMNYNHQLSGIVQSAAVGSPKLSQCSRDADCGFNESCQQRSCRRMDYSTQLLPTGGNTPGALDETDLDETAGLGSWSRDVALFSTCEAGGAAAFGVAPAHGPIDWDGDGDATDQHLSTDIDFRHWGTQFDCNQPLLTLRGFDDWEHLLGAAASDNERGPRTHSSAAEPPSNADERRLSALLHAEQRHPRELDADTARRQHLLLAPREAQFVVVTGCQAAGALVGDPNGVVDIAVLAQDDFDVGLVDAASLRLHHAAPIGIALRDVNADGRPDLVVSFRVSDTARSRGTSLRLTGWFRDSRAFVGEEETPLCR